VNEPPFDAEDERYMRLAIELASHGMMTTRANPRVGCVLVKAGQIIGQGYHVRPGESHAEVNALASVNGQGLTDKGVSGPAGQKIADATAYVTLEPCAHFGRTPPCAHALVEAAIRRVVVASVDPNPRVDGGGINYLREHGVEVHTGLLDNEARALNPGFFSRMQRGRPWIRAKVAASLDGRSALANGISQWITGPAARADVQHYRARACAILTGADTVIADDPSLTVRLNTNLDACAEHASDIAQPLRVIVDGRARIAESAKLLRLPGNTLVASHVNADPQRIAALRRAGAEVVQLDGPDSRISLVELTAVLAKREINEVHTEAGPQLLGALLRATLIDELVWYVAPHLLGIDAHAGINAGPFTMMSERPEFTITDCARIGSDVRLVLTPSPT
jgi:diaminohydroxyphosphoribosylaminopyrimidine deaminase / 5-amino-6-(5-phosphoribosylamino)uracil reductase